ncbi:hypothetical protein AA101099_0371 [Neoasaia chiangmaiensis NBRC 101099]|uniref:Uncharacterized protein n=1 Tax=Neoasaia chiangmaiensis TaxID=320497 RepID=A0A1U9KRV7_9PROT|nr:hypothetical protein [Neoasaia chiangmaiensis]AQS88505.1 hypothetical protein A0U93_11805 [Neoasaia chiangmaiensis]GBR36457.1 hypothetical protein AA101099_0371 [Neoasaia chiangmaiensis NBRC 101099]GEN15334.1 hypothetical protein NCH01_17650 [Neoasaia chiangmaiensis]
MNEFANFPLMRDALVTAQPDQPAPVAAPGEGVNPGYQSFDMLARLEEIERAGAGQASTHGRMPGDDSFGVLQASDPAPAAAVEPSMRAGQAASPPVRVPSNSVKDSVGDGQHANRDIPDVWRRRPLSALFAYLRGEAVEAAASERSLRDIFG